LIIAKSRLGGYFVFGEGVFALPSFLCHQEEYKSRISTYIGRKREKGDVDCSLWQKKNDVAIKVAWRPQSSLREYASSLTLP